MCDSRTVLPLSSVGCMPNALLPPSPQAERVILPWSHAYCSAASGRDLRWHLHLSPFALLLRSQPLSMACSDIHMHHISMMSFMLTVMTTAPASQCCQVGISVRAPQAMHAHLLVLLDLNIHLGGRVWEGAAAVGFPEEVRLSHLQQQQRFSKLTPRV